MKTILISALALSLQGCWFIFIPGSVISGVGDAIGGYEGQHCVAETAKVGDKIRHPNGSMGTVAKLEGTSTRCTNAFQPIRALVTF